MTSPDRRRNDPKGGVPVFVLLQWKYAIKLEAKGLHHSSGRSVHAHAKRVLGIRGSREATIAYIDKLLLQIAEAT